MDILDKWLGKTFGVSRPGNNNDKKARPVAQNDSQKRDFFPKKAPPHHGQRPTTNETRFPSRPSSPHQSGRPHQPHRGQRPTTNEAKQPPHRPSLPKQTALPPIRVTAKKGVMRIIPMGGLNEVGQNMMIFEYENDIIIVDMGFLFPDNDMLGIDYIIPDITYLEQRRQNIRAVIITHAHLDHIGAIPYILPKLGFPPIYGTRLSLGLVEQRLEEFKLNPQARLNVINPTTDRFVFGAFEVEFFRVNHSIPDSMGVYIKSPAGTAVHTGDFKFDATPADGIPADIDKMVEFGNRGIDVLLSDSTNALKPGKTVSEQVIGETLDEIIKNTHSRIIIASFSSLIGRIGQVLDSASRHGRKVFISGRSMEQNVEMAAKLGYIKVPPNLIYPIKSANDVPDRDCLVLTTGAQGEPMSALARIALGDHRDIEIKKGDTVIVSSTPIPGNETAVFSVINNLARAGAKVIHHKIMDVHVSGHGQKEDLRTMIKYVRPKFLVPIHGEYFMRQAHGEIALEEEGYKEEHVILAENGQVIEVKNHIAILTKETVPNKYILIDGLGMGSKDHEILSDRKHMSENGVMIPLFRVHQKSRKLKKGEVDIVSRGFIYMDESKEIVQKVRDAAEKAYEEITKQNPNASRREIKLYIRQKLDKKVDRLIGRRPLIIPVIIEV